MGAGGRSSRVRTRLWRRAREQRTLVRRHRCQQRRRQRDRGTPVRSPRSRTPRPYSPTTSAAHPAAGVTHVKSVAEFDLDAGSTSHGGRMLLLRSVSRSITTASSPRDIYRPRKAVGSVPGLNAQLERWAGVPPFERTTRRVTLTPVGRQLRDIWRRRTGRSRTRVRERRRGGATARPRRTRPTPSSAPTPPV